MKTSVMTQEATSRDWLIGVVAWLMPGAGHLLLGRVWRGLLLGGSVMVMFLTGLYLGGHLFGLHNVSESGALAYVFGFCDLGTGAFYLLCLVTNSGLIEQARLATAEYGNVLLMVAGLMNYLVMLDAFDISVGRKH